MSGISSGQTANSLSVQATVNCLSLIAKWAEALQGHGEVVDAISQISQLSGADVVGLSAYTTNERSPTNYAIVDRSAGQLFSSRRWDAYARDLLGDHFAAARETSIWMLSELQSFPDFSRRRVFADGVGQGLKEIVIIVLEKSDCETIVLEFHYRLAPIPAGLAMLKLLATALAQSWSNRLPGIPRSPALRSIACDEGAGAATPGPCILTHDNPVGLSRTEFRICMLVRDGKKSAAIADALDIGEKTVRGHLSTIYAKVGVSGQFELLHRLLGDTAQDQGTLVRRVG